MNAVAHNLLQFEFQSPKRKTFNPKPHYMEKNPSFSNVRNLNERINSEQELKKIPSGHLEENEENIVFTPERAIHKLPESDPAYVNKPHDYFAKIRKDIGLAYAMRPSERTRTSPTEEISRRRRESNSNRKRVKSRVRGYGPGMQTNRLGLGFSKIVSPSPVDRREIDECFYSPNTVKREYYEATYNYFSTEYCDKAHISGLLQQIKSLEQENKGLIEKLEKRENQLLELNKEETEVEQKEKEKEE